MLRWRLFAGASGNKTCSSPWSVWVPAANACIDEHVPETGYLAGSSMASQRRAFDLLDRRLAGKWLARP